MHLAGLTNVMRQVGIARHGRRHAHRARRGRRRRCGGAAWRDRAEAIVEQLRDYRLVRPNGGWPLLAGTARLGLCPAEGSARLFVRGWVAATPMAGGARPANATCGWCSPTNRSSASPDPVDPMRTATRHQVPVQCVVPALTVRRRGRVLVSLTGTLTRKACSAL